MKLTSKLKDEIDNYSKAKMISLFRFFPSDITTGESGRYIQEKARSMSDKNTDPRKLSLR